MWGIPEKSFQKAVLTVLTQISALSQFANNGNWIQAQYYAKRPQTFKYIEFHLLGYLRAYTGVCQRERIGPKYGGLAALPALACQKLSLPAKKNIAFFSTVLLSSYLVPKYLKAAFKEYL